MFGTQQLWSRILDAAVEFVETRCQDRYLKAVGCWNRIQNEQTHWLQAGWLFPYGDRHDASWWVNNGGTSENDESLQRGLHLYEELLGVPISLSHIAVFCGLKGMWGNRLSARLLCEVAGIKPDVLDNRQIILQLLNPTDAGIDAQALVGVSEFVRSSPGTNWKCYVDLITPTMLVLNGSSTFSTEADAVCAVNTLMKTPNERMMEAGRTGRPGTGVNAVHKVRARASSLKFHNEGMTLLFRAEFELVGRLL